MINEDGVEIEHGMVVYEPWKGGYYRKSEVDEKIKRLRRALYKACANWADCEAGRLFWEEDMDKSKKFDKMVDKCHAMADKWR